MAINLIILDCGHNFSDTYQKRSPIRDDGTRFYEYESNRHIGTLVAKELDKLGIRYEWTINPVNKNDMTLRERVYRANEIALRNGKMNTLYLSLHSDAYGDGEYWYDNANGYTVYTSKGKTKSDSYAKVFLDMAKETLPNYGKRIRGHKEEDFFVLKHTVCPAVLLEQLFYTSHTDLEFLDSSEGRKVLADIIVNAIRRIVGE